MRVSAEKLALALEYGTPTALPVFVHLATLVWIWRRMSLVFQRRLREGRRPPPSRRMLRLRRLQVLTQERW